MSDYVLEATQLCKSYKQGSESVDVLQNLNLQVTKGECVSIVGASGSGKSTLLNLLGGLDSPDQGQVLLMRKSFADYNSAQRGILRNQHLGFVYQFHHLLPEFTAFENVLMPLMIAKLDLKTAQKKVTTLLDQVGMSHRLTHKPAELSGGERQRVAIARALACTPNCVLMDEPTGNLDQANGQSIKVLMKELNQLHETSFVVVTHDLDFASAMDRSVSLSNGQLEAL